MCVCGHKNEHFERSRPAYELYFLCMSQKSKNISFYIPHEQERNVEEYIPSNSAIIVPTNFTENDISIHLPQLLRKSSLTKLSMRDGLVSSTTTMKIGLRKDFCSHKLAINVGSAEEC